MSELVEGRRPVGSNVPAERAPRWLENRYDRNGSRVAAPPVEIASATVTWCTSERFTLPVSDASANWNAWPTGANSTFGVAEALIVVVNVNLSAIVGAPPAPG